MSNPDAIPSWGDAVVAPVTPRDTRNPAPPPDCLDGWPLTRDFGAMGARR